MTVERIQEYGSKGAHLKWLETHQNLGYLVPEFYIIPTEVFDEISKEVISREDLEDLRRLKVNVKDKQFSDSFKDSKWARFNLEKYVDLSKDQLENNRQKILETGLKYAGMMGFKDSLLNSNIGFEDLSSRLEPYFEALKGKPFSVRSSSTCEDGIDNSFAGFFLTILPSEHANLESDRVKKTYDIRKGTMDYVEVASQFFGVREALDEEGMDGEDSLGVIVQEFIPTEISGVIYTSIPEDQETLTISFVEGRCDRAVKGKSDTTVYFDRRSKLQILEGNRMEVPKEKVSQIIDVGLKLEEEYKRPLDIEFGYNGDQLYLFQARPIVDYVSRSFSIPEGAKKTVEIPVNLSSGGFVGRLVKYQALIKSSNDLKINQPYILITDEIGNNYWNIADLPENCGGVIVVGNDYINRCSHDANILRRLKKVITSTDNLDFDFEFEDRGIFEVSKNKYVLASHGRSASLYRL